jgi:hypothetical protein
MFHSGEKRPAGPTISSLIDAPERGAGKASEALSTALYGELKRLPKRELARHSSAVSVSPTTLLHQPYLDIAAADDLRFPDRARFMGYAARVMRSLIIDDLRNRQVQKRGGQFKITSLTNKYPNIRLMRGSLRRSATRWTNWRRPSLRWPKLST